MFKSLSNWGLVLTYNVRVPKLNYLGMRWLSGFGGKFSWRQFQNLINFSHSAKFNQLVSFSNIFGMPGIFRYFVYKDDFLPSRIWLVWQILLQVLLSMRSNVQWKCFTNLGHSCYLLDLELICFFQIHWHSLVSWASRRRGSLTILAC